jgi:hypothetical protein
MSALTKIELDMLSRSVSGEQRPLAVCSEDESRALGHLRDLGLLVVMGGPGGLVITEKGRQVLADRGLLSTGTPQKDGAVRLPAPW